jgi:hypothetical protein
MSRCRWIFYLALPTECLTHLVDAVQIAAGDQTLGDTFGTTREQFRCAALRPLGEAARAFARGSRRATVSTTLTA